MRGEARRDESRPSPSPSPSPRPRPLPLPSPSLYPHPKPELAPRPTFAPRPQPSPLTSLQVFTKKAEEADAALREAYKKEIIAAEAAVRQEGAAQRTALEESLAAAAQERLFSLTSPRPKLALTRA